MNRWRRARPVLLAAIAVAVTSAGCAIQPDASPRDVPLDERIELDPASGPDAGQATGTGRIFLAVTDPADGQTRLRSVLRNASESEPLFEALFDGPNADEFDAGLDSALPTELSLNSARITASTLTVDVSDEILALQSADDLRLAVAQIVYTAHEIEGVRGVRLRVDGAAREWPNGRGQARTDALTVYDFPNFAESAQPSYPPIRDRTS